MPAQTRPATYSGPSARAPQQPESVATQPTQSLPPLVLNPQPVQGSVPLNVRVPADISATLLRVSMTRKFQRQHPFTQREMVAEALTDWLEKRGYLHARTS